MKSIRHRAIFRALIVIGFFTIAAGASLAGDITGKVTATGVRPAGIVVYIDATGQDYSPSSQHAVMDQKKMTFIPHVLVVLRGTTVDFLNSDPVGHNVYWPSVGGNKKLTHNLGTWPQGVKK